jgi:hypothetical protein
LFAALISGRIGQMPVLRFGSISGDCASKRCVQDGPARLSEPIQNDPDPVRLKQGWIVTTAGTVAVLVVGHQRFFGM